MTFARNRKNGGDIRTPLQYMAEHTLYMRDKVVDDPSVFLIQNPKGYETSKVVMIG
jgi:hypothetical protein